MSQIDLHFKNKKVLIMGLGLHGGGVATALWFVKKGARVTITDLRSKKILKQSLDQLRKCKSITYVLGKHRIADFTSTNIVIKNPGVLQNSPYIAAAKKVGVPIETDVSIFFRLCRADIIGVTGTKGKTTTAFLIYEMMKQAGRHTVITGNMGRSPLSVVSRLAKKSIVVLELSSWQLEDMRHLGISPHVSVITNVLRDHLDRHSTMAKYVRAKLSIFSFQHDHDISVVNYDNTYTKKIGKRVTSKRVWFSQRRLLNQNAVFVENDIIKNRLDGKEVVVGALKDIALLGEHNVGNVLAAIAVARVYKVSPKIIRMVLKKLKFVPGRLELIRKWRGITFYNDTTATMPDATIAALKSVPGKTVLIAGGSDKKLLYGEMVSVIKKRNVFAVLLKGTATQKIVKLLKTKKYDKFAVVNSMDDAIVTAIQYASRGMSVVLSPGAASFGMFDHEFDRGDQFNSAVMKFTR